MADKYADAKHYAYRYNNLQVYMDPARITEPHFFVSIGISEASFAIEGGKKIDGGLGQEDGLVSRWATRTNIYNELKNYWRAMKDALAAEIEEDMAKKSSAEIRLKRIEQSSERLEVDMTGTGIDKTKRNRMTKRYEAPESIDSEKEERKNE